MMNQKQILCVEDEAAIILPLRYALEREGWNVSWANTGAQALQYLSEHKCPHVEQQLHCSALSAEASPAHKNEQKQ
jgi:CheY-like chemotaxis protein